jgi:hypothetical protein
MFQDMQAAMATVSTQDSKFQSLALSNRHLGYLGMLPALPFFLNKSLKIQSQVIRNGVAPGSS